MEFNDARMNRKRNIFLSDIDLGELEIREVVKVLRSKWLSQGWRTQKFEQEFCRYLKCKHAFAVSSCTAALHLALRALGVGSKDEVIVPSLTFVATVNAVLYVGAKPVFADAASTENFNISPEDIRKKITKKTKAIVVMHYGGYACEMDEIKKIAKRHNLFIIEDAAHAVGGEYKGKKLGTLGDVGCYSFFANKNLVTGEGGLIVTHDNQTAGKIKLLRSHGMTTSSWERYKEHSYSYDVVDMGYSYPFDEIRAAIGLVQLKKLDKNNAKRKALVQRYQKNLKPMVSECLTLPFQYSPYRSSYHLFPVLLDKKINRDAVIDSLKKIGIQTSIHYPPVHTFSFYRKHFRGVHLPVTEDIGNRVMTLPLHPLLKPSDIDYISEKTKRILQDLCPC